MDTGRRVLLGYPPSVAPVAFPPSGSVLTGPAVAAPAVYPNPLHGPYGMLPPVPPKGQGMPLPSQSTLYCTLHCSCSFYNLDDVAMDGNWDDSNGGECETDPFKGHHGELLFRLPHVGGAPKD